MSAQHLTLYNIDMDGSMEPDENGRWARADDAVELQTQLAKTQALATNLETTVRKAFAAYEKGDRELVRGLLLGTLMGLTEVR